MKRNFFFIIQQTMSLAIQVISDIHLEYQCSFLKLEPLCPYLFVVGDVGHITCSHWNAFWQYCSQHWKRVFVVLGNHEYYGTHSQKIQTMTELESAYETYFQTLKNVILLQYGQMAQLDKEHHLYIIGTTGWSKPKEKAKHLINDFRNIYVDTQSRLTPFTMATLHEKEFGWLLQHVKSNPDKEFIVMTHFPPITGGVSHPRYEQDETNDPAFSYFRNNYHLEISEYPNIRAWLFGHTHYSSVQQRHGILYISNQYGVSARERGESVFRQDGLFVLS